MKHVFAKRIERARSQVDCARSLFRDGFVRECHDYMVNALHLQLAAWGDSDDATSESSDARAQREQGLSALEQAGYRRIQRLRAASLAIADIQPNSGTGLTPDLDWVWSEVERLTRFSTLRALTPRARKLRRWFGGVLLVGIAALTLLIGFLLWGRPRAQASGFISEDHSAANAVDGLQATEWLLPDASAGWVDVLLPRARTIHRVRLFNAHNRVSADRATRAVRITAFSAVGTAVTVEGAFQHFSEKRSELVLPLSAENVNRLRVEVKTYFKSGGGLAEVEIE